VSRAFFHADQVIQGKMSSRFIHVAGATAFAALLAFNSPVLAQSDDVDPEKSCNIATASSKSA